MNVPDYEAEEEGEEKSINRLKKIHANVKSAPPPFSGSWQPVIKPRNFSGSSESLDRKEAQLVYILHS